MQRRTQATRQDKAKSIRTIIYLYRPGHGGSSSQPRGCGWRSPTPPPPCSEAAPDRRAAPPRSPALRNEAQFQRVHAKRRTRITRGPRAIPRSTSRLDSVVSSSLSALLANGLILVVGRVNQVPRVQLDLVGHDLAGEHAVVVVVHEDNHLAGRPLLLARLALHPVADGKAQPLPLALERLVST